MLQVRSRLLEVELCRLDCAKLEGHDVQVLDKVKYVGQLKLFMEEPQGCRAAA